MRRLLIAIAVVATLAVIGPVWAQVAPQPWPAAYRAQPYPFPSITPDDAYRQGLINRWELERIQGPMPQALQGPSVDGSKGMQTGGGG